MFNPEDILKFKNYNQSIIDSPRAWDQQPSKRENGSLWCDDWEIIEILKYFFNGHDGYMGDPPPNRLKNNPLFSKEAIVNEAAKIKGTFETADLIIQYFKARRAEVHDGT